MFVQNTNFSNWKCSTWILRAVLYHVEIATRKSVLVTKKARNGVIA